MFCRKLFVFAIVLIATGCSAKTIDGKSSDDVFVDLRVKALAEAACKGQQSKVKKIVREHNNVNARGFEDVTPLMWAVLCKSPAGVTSLLEAGADPNQKAYSEVTSVTLAASFEDPEILETLLHAGGDPNAEYLENSRDGSALKIAFKTGIYKDNWSSYELLLDMGADINRPTKKLRGLHGSSLAQYAMIWARFCKISDLLDLGYDYKLSQLLITADQAVISERAPGFPCKEIVIQKLKAKIDPADYHAYLDEVEARSGINQDGNRNRLD